MSATTYSKTPNLNLQTDSGPTGIRGINFEYAVTSCQGWRTTQEDAHLVIPKFEDDTSLFAVFDGHNGPEVSSYVSKNLPEYIKRNKKYQNGQIVDGLKEAFLALDSNLNKPEVVAELLDIRHIKTPYLMDNWPGFTSGSTAVVVLLKNRTIYCANLGDSRCVLCRNGQTVPLSFDHQPENPSEHARIERAGGIVVKNRINLKINVSRAFGDHSFKMNTDRNQAEQMVIALPDVVVMDRKLDDQFMLLMCDGIWNSIEMDELVSQVHKRIQNSEKLSAIAEDIVQKLIPKKNPGNGIKGMDNMTLMIVRFIKPKSANDNSGNRSPMSRSGSRVRTIRKVPFISKSNSSTTPTTASNKSSGKKSK